MQGNAEAHFHLGLMYLRRHDGEEALRALQHCKALYIARYDEHVSAGTMPSERLLGSLARVRIHTAHAAYLAASEQLSHAERKPLLGQLQKDMVSAIQTLPPPPATHAADGDDGEKAGDADADELMAERGNDGGHATAEAAAPRSSKRRRVALVPATPGGGSGDPSPSMAAQMRPAAEMWNSLALLHLSEGGVPAARAVLRRLVAAVPEYADARSNLAVAELAAGREAAAATALAGVLAVDPSHVEARCNYALLCLRHGLPGRALALLRPATAGTCGVGRGLTFAWATTAVAHAARGEWHQAAAAAAEAERVAECSTDKDRFGLLAASMRARLLMAEIAAIGDGEMLTVAGEDAAAAAVAAAATGVTGAAVAPPLSLADAAVREEELRMEIDKTVVRLRAAARAVGTPSAMAGLGTVLRMRHERAWEDAGIRNYGSEAAERLVESLEATSDAGGPGPAEVAAAAAGRTGLVGRAAPAPVPAPTPASAPAHPSVSSTGAVAGLPFPPLPGGPPASDDESDGEAGVDGRGRQPMPGVPTDGPDGDGGGVVNQSTVAAVGKSVNPKGCAAARSSGQAEVWVQLSLLQAGAGEYASAADFAVQAVSRNDDQEAGWAALGVVSQLADLLPDAERAYEKAVVAAHDNHAASALRAKTLVVPGVVGPDREVADSGVRGDVSAVVLGGSGGSVVPSIASAAAAAAASRSGGAGSQEEPSLGGALPSFSLPLEPSLPMGSPPPPLGSLTSLPGGASMFSSLLPTEEEAPGISFMPSAGATAGSPVSHLPLACAPTLSPEAAAVERVNATLAAATAEAAAASKSATGSTPAAATAPGAPTAASASVPIRSAATEVVPDSTSLPSHTHPPVMPREDAATRSALAAVYTNLGNLRRQQPGHLAEARAAYRKALLWGAHASGAATDGQGNGGVDGGVDGGDHVLSGSSSGSDGGGPAAAATAVDGQTAVDAETFRTSAERTGAAIVFSNMAVLHASDKQFSQALDAVERARQLAPGLACARSNMLKLRRMTASMEGLTLAPTAAARGVGAAAAAGAAASTKGGGVSDAMDETGGSHTQAEEELYDGSSSYVDGPTVVTTPAVATGGASLPVLKTPTAGKRGRGVALGRRGSTERLLADEHSPL